MRSEARVKKQESRSKSQEARDKNPELRHKIFRPLIELKLRLRIEH